MSTHGPWRIVDHRTSRLVLPVEGGRTLTYEVEYRSREPGCEAGYYLFGAGVEYGHLLHATSAATARYEAVARIATHSPHPDVGRAIALAPLLTGGGGR